MQLSINHQHLQNASETARQLLGWSQDQETEYVMNLGIAYLKHRHRYTKRYKSNSLQWNWIRLEYCKACYNALAEWGKKNPGKMLINGKMYPEYQGNYDEAFHVLHSRQVKKIYNYYLPRGVYTTKKTVSV